MLKDSKSLEISCYVVGAGAFGVFFRWMQLMLAYNEEDLPDASAWNVLVPLFIAAGAFVFARFISKMNKEGLFLSEDMFIALRNDGKIYSVCRWVIGGLMIVGSILLLATCELDLNVVFLRILAAFGILTGVAFPLLLTMVNKPHVSGNGTMTLLAVLPVLMFSVWLLTCYKQNSINPVQWDYAVEILALIITLLAFLRMAGFAYGVVNTDKSRFLCMFGAMLCVMTIADKRYLGQQIMFAAAALMMVMYNWIMVENLQRRETVPFENVGNTEDGSEQL